MTSLAVPSRSSRAISESCKVTGISWPVSLALPLSSTEGRKLSANKIERVAQTTLSRKRPRLHLRFGGQPPKQWHSVHYGRSIKKSAKDIRAELGINVDTSS